MECVFIYEKKGYSLIPKLKGRPLGSPILRVWGRTGDGQGILAQAMEMRHKQLRESMKLLYLSCHAVLEFDELTLFDELGIEFCSLGAYLNPKEPSDNIRPPLKTEPNPKWISMKCSKENVSQDFINEFDVLMIMHMPEWIEKNWEKIRNKTVIWRTIGQSSPYAEKIVSKFRKQGLKIVRYSQKKGRSRDLLEKML